MFLELEAVAKSSINKDEVIADGRHMSSDLKADSFFDDIKDELDAKHA